MAAKQLEARDQEFPNELHDAPSSVSRLVVVPAQEDLKRSGLAARALRVGIKKQLPRASLVWGLLYHRLDLL